MFTTQGDISPCNPLSKAAPNELPNRIDHRSAGAADEECLPRNGISPLAIPYRRQRPMNSQTVLTIGQQALQMTLMISAPLLLTALIVGLFVSVLQAATQINEMTLSFIPKLLALFAALVIAGPWMLATFTEY